MNINEYQFWDDDINAVIPDEDIETVKIYPKESASYIEIHKDDVIALVKHFHISSHDF